MSYITTFNDVAPGQKFNFIESGAIGRPRIYTKLSPQKYASRDGDEYRLFRISREVKVLDDAGILQ